MEDEKSKISIQDLESLLKKVQKRDISKLSQQDFQLIISLLESYEKLTVFLKGRAVNIFRLKKFFNSLFVNKG